MALAPRRDLLAVPSSSVIRMSSRRWSAASKPAKASKISPLTASTAASTPLPPYRDASPSRFSTASCAPVEAPDGTAARPRDPSSRTTSTSTVGLPRLSRIWRARMSTISVMAKAPVCGGIFGGGLAHSRGEPKRFGGWGLRRSSTNRPVPERLVIERPLLVAEGGKAILEGAGFAGLASGIALSRAGWEVTVVAQAPRIEPAGAGDPVMPSSGRSLPPRMSC